MARASTQSNNSGGDIPFPHPANWERLNETGFAPDADVRDDHRHDALIETGPETLLAAFCRDVCEGLAWFDALLDCIRNWETPREIVDGREYVYLIEQEAFDWLLLAERICDAAPAGLLPTHEVDTLLVDEWPPVALSEPEFQKRLGTPKYWAHLNFFYGVRVEQALHLTIERVLQKERSGLDFSHQRQDLDADVFGRIYGARQPELLREYRAANDRQHVDPERIEHAEWQAFTYWLFRRRLKRQDPARVASDTQQGLHMLYELETTRQQRRLRRAAESARPMRNSDAADVIDGVLVGVG